MPSNEVECNNTLRIWPDQVVGVVGVVDDAITSCFSTVGDNLRKWLRDEKQFECSGLLQVAFFDGSLQETRLVSLLAFFHFVTLPLLWRIHYTTFSFAGTFSTTVKQAVHGNYTLAESTLHCFIVFFISFLIRLLLFETVLRHNKSCFASWWIHSWNRSNYLYDHPRLVVRMNQIESSSTSLTFWQGIYVTESSTDSTRTIMTIYRHHNDM